VLVAAMLAGLGSLVWLTAHRMAEVERPPAAARGR
jgi:hypothetical protein